MRVVIQSGIPIEELTDYFENKVHRVTGQVYASKNWQVEVKTEKGVRYKSLPIPQTQLVFSGEEEAVEREVRQYRRTFLRGGG